jgi:octanoyl-[GcvH]:protein N-octanoyltransferase
MSHLHALLEFEKFRYIDQSEYLSDASAMESFATDDALCLSVSEGISPPAARLWVHDQTIVLGIPDSRLPFLKDGVSFLKQEGYSVIVRNSGGLAVVLDEGILNVTFVFPDAKAVSIHDGYEAMVSFVKEIFATDGVSIEAFEVKGSYCPGEFDLSINGKKFAGISQRRVKNGTAVQIYLCVEGSGADRARLIREFYKRALKGETATFTYPDIRPETMASLSELLYKPISVAEVTERILAKLEEISENIITEHLQPGKELDWYERRLEQMKVRNEKAFE